MRYLFSVQQWKKQISSARRIFLFLDFDGTLSSIVKKPDQARIFPQIKTLLRFVARHKNIIVAIISGRHKKDLMRRVGLRGIIYFGWHGLRANFKGKTHFLKTLSTIKREVKKYRLYCPNLIEEDKEIILALHYRNLSPPERSCWQELRKKLQAFAVKGDIRLGYGKKVLEIRPNQRFGKGEAVKGLLKLKSRSREDLAIYIGDDLTDEDGFRALARKDITVRIGYKRMSAARYFLRRPQEVGKVLSYLLNSKREYN